MSLDLLLSSENEGGGGRGEEPRGEGKEGKGGRRKEGRKGERGEGREEEGVNELGFLNDGTRPLRLYPTCHLRCQHSGLLSVSSSSFSEGPGSHSCASPTSHLSTQEVSFHATETFPRCSGSVLVGTCLRLPIMLCSWWGLPLSSILRWKPQDHDAELLPNKNCSQKQHSRGEVPTQLPLCPVRRGPFPLSKILRSDGN